MGCRTPMLVDGDDWRVAAVGRWGVIFNAPPRRGAGEAWVLPLVLLVKWQRACVDDATAVGSAAVGAIFWCAAGRGAGEDSSPGQFIYLL